MAPDGTPSVAVGSASKGKPASTREDWIRAAKALLVSKGIDRVKVLALSDQLQVSRSSFYWFFKSRQALLDALLDAWRQSNTRSMIEACEEPADTITAAVCNLFRRFIDPAQFDPQLDFAIREWSRRSDRVRAVVDQADAERLAATARMFERHGYPADEAETRARILYYMQIGYYALELSEPLEQRLSYLRGYLVGFTGREPDEAEIAAVMADARATLARINGAKKGD